MGDDKFLPLPSPFPVNPFSARGKETRYCSGPDLITKEGLLPFLFHGTCSAVESACSLVQGWSAVVGLEFTREVPVADRGMTS